LKVAKGENLRGWNVIFFNMGPKAQLVQG